LSTPKNNPTREFGGPLGATRHGGRSSAPTSC
jgi:hypothetical protein